MKNFLMLLMVGTMVVTGCSKKAVKTDESNTPNTANADLNLNGDSDTGKASGLQTIHFAYDSFVIDGQNKATLQANAQILKDKPSLKIQVEGHCDAKGGIQYNLALGEKRANAVKKFLADQGISGERVMIISFGKEKLIDNGDSEEANAKNRRANFVITSH